MTDCHPRVLGPRDGAPGAVPSAAGREARAVLQKVLGWIVAILLVVWIVSNPAAAGNTLHSWVTGIITFFQHVA